MRTLAAALVALAGASCSDSAHYYGEEFAGYYRGPSEAARSERIDRKEIIHWGSNPKDKKRIGFLHKYESQPRGSRSTREGYQIMNALGNKALGMITDEGRFYRYDEHGRPSIYINEYKIIVVGLKVFFGIPQSENLDLEEIDPYK